MKENEDGDEDNNAGQIWRRRNQKEFFFMDLSSRSGYGDDSNEDKMVMLSDICIFLLFRLVYLYSLVFSFIFMK